MKNRTWYVYHLIDSRDNKTFYIGKGYGRRMYIHKVRALKWKEKGRQNKKCNMKLYNKILSILDNNIDIVYKVIKEFEDENDSLLFERKEIETFGLENLCNLTTGGEGPTRSPEFSIKLSNSLKDFWSSDKGLTIRKKISESRMGKNNPMFGKKEDEEHKKLRMKNFLAKERWNKGLTKKDDSRISGWEPGRLPHNAKKIILQHEDGRIVDALSIKDAAKKANIPYVMLQKMIYGYKLREKSKRGWKIISINGVLFDDIKNDNSEK